MRHLTIEEIKKINEINGTLADRYEYFDKLAEILGTEFTRVRWNQNYMQAIRMDETTILDIDTKTKKGHRMITVIRIMDSKKTEEHKYGQSEYWNLKKNELVKW